MFITHTVIGRKIPPGEEIEKEKNEVLLQLYQFHYNIFNPKDVPMGLRNLSNAVGLSEKRIKDVCNILIDQKLVEKMSAGHNVFYRIIGRGIQFVEKHKVEQE